jgi:WD40 repeat protein
VNIPQVWDISQFTGEMCSTIEQKQLAMRELCHWQAHSLAITSIEYVPKGDMLVTSSLDCTVIMWTIKVRL